MAKVFDSSAVLAFLYDEPGADKVRVDLPDGVISAVNAAEVLAVLVRNGAPLEDASLALQKTRLKVQEFSLAGAAKTAALLSPQSRSLGLSPGDRACMATAILLKLPAVTAERIWTGIEVPDLRIECIRG
jgi:PIN domain nuclease of toxin-antitoxin system